MKSEFSSYFVILHDYIMLSNIIIRYSEGEFDAGLQS